MATPKKGLVEKAMKSKPVAATKGLINKAVDATVDAFQNPPLAPELPRPSRRAAAKKSAGKRASRKSGGASKAMDRRLASGMETYEVKYLAQKHGVTQKAVKAAVAKVGNSRNKVEAELKRGKA